MEKHKFERIVDFKGHSVQYFTTHADLVKRQAAAREAKKAEHDRQKGIARRDWTGRFRQADRCLARGND